MTGTIITDDMKSAVEGFCLTSVLDELESFLDSKMMDNMIVQEAFKDDKLNNVEIPENDVVESIHGNLPEAEKIKSEQEHFTEPGELNEIFLILSCNDCDLKTDSEQILKLHINYKHRGGEERLKKPRRVTKIKPRWPQNSSDVGDLCQCRICEFSTTSNRKLVIHFKNEHSGEKLYNCDICSYRSNWLPNLMNHKESIHDPKIYHCEQCDFETKWKSTFLGHMRETHGVFKKASKFSNIMKKPIVCDRCEYTAITTQLMQHHKITEHNNQERNFKCDFCERKLFTKNGLVQHKLWKHKKTAEERSKYFMPKHKWWMHKKTDEETSKYPCDTDQSYMLKKHQENNHDRITTATNEYELDIIKIGNNHDTDVQNASRIDRMDLDTKSKNASLKDFNAKVSELMVKNDSGWKCIECPYETRSTGDAGEHAETHVSYYI